MTFISHNSKVIYDENKKDRNMKFGTLIVKHSQLSKMEDIIISQSVFTVNESISVVSPMSL